MEALSVGASADALLLEPDGKLSALLRVTRTDGQGFVLDVDGGYGQAVAARLRRFLLRSKVEMEPLAWRCLSLRGAAVGEAAAGLLAVLAERGVLALPFAWNGWAGVDLLGPEDVVLGTRRAGPPPWHRGVRCRGRGSLPHRLGDTGHGHRADGQDHRGRGRAGGADGQLHQGLLHGPGAGGAHRLPGLQRGSSPGRGGGAGGAARGRAARAGHDAAQRGPRPAATARPTTRSPGPSPRRPGAWSWGPGSRSGTCTATPRRRARSGSARGDGVGGSRPVRAELLPLVGTADPEPG